MPVIEYTPSGRTAYTCVLATPGGQELIVRAVDGGTADVQGDDRLRQNAALVTLLSAYGAHEHQYRRLRADEKRKSHQKQSQRHKREALSLIGMIEVLGERTRSGWCTACLTPTTHRRLQGPARPTPIYLCDNCGAPTTPCAVPGCNHFARRGLRAATTPRYCAEHRHEIPAFRKLNEQLETIDDFESWLKYEKRNASRISKITAVAVVGGAVVAPVAFAAAAAIGGATGSFAGLSGAAATSHGLALWGGGSLAAGGLGMAGGTTVISALGGGLGTALGASIAAAYVSTDSSFRIQKLREGEGTPVLFATGFLTEAQDGWGDWEVLIDGRYVDSPVYRVHWGAKELKALSWAVGQEVGRRAARRALRELAQTASKKAVGRLTPLGSLLFASGVAKNPWSVARTRAEMTGAVLADLIARTNQPFILMGHSLGARVMVTAAQLLGTRDGDPKIEAIHLFGAAVSAGGDWRTLNDAVVERVWNYHSRNDSVLAYVYRTAALGRPAVGRVGFGSSFPKITDRDVSRRANSHTTYVPYVKLVKDRSR